jgi:hypothetical protein
MVTSTNSPALFQETPGPHDLASLPAIHGIRTEAFYSMLTTAITTKSASSAEAYEIAQGTKKEWIRKRDAEKVVFEKYLKCRNCGKIYVAHQTGRKWGELKMQVDRILVVWKQGEVGDRLMDGCVRDVRREARGA